MAKQNNRKNSSANSRRREKQSKEEPKKQKKGGLRPVELIAITCFCIAGLLFAVSKCGGGNTNENTVNNNAANPTSTNNSLPATPIPNKDTVMYTQGSEVPLREKTSFLYVVIDSFKLRKGPDIRDTIIEYLRIGQEVIDLKQRTDKEETFKIKQGLRPKTAPWVKVKTKSGNEGWVFAAGLEFYKSKDPMPDEDPVESPDNQTPTNNNSGNSNNGNTDVDSTVVNNN
ncbi:MAG: SH3 domain-containing protein [Saprospiraceae bacterium]|nr:SH3 domain-containing protein [Saprospiraceae bacterium]